MELLLEQLAGWEGGQILGDVDAGLAKFEEFDLLLFLPGAKNQPKRRVFAELLLIFSQPAEVKLHLAFVFGFGY